MDRPKIGVGVFIFNKDINKFLMSKRKDCGRVALMGGHLERFETICECAQREVLEESNLSIPLLHYREYPTAFNAINKEDNYHYVTFFAVAIKPDDQEFSNTEPEKQEDWEWYGEEEFIKVYKEKKLYYSIECLFKSCNEDFNILIERIKQLIK
ncbi:NUDIX hydrolase (macronuclear) [Tetrahymena thermophila SB210]|uniref:NUDIX hydrolase n=1 Tax=Tetrahymena thermophila (strain SB210) TaxID=312017 RepID=Q22GV0_TETTS|nr:NUDIX hydrolase [Tetrahymena thermophila SB210]EAR84574.1 NUDIX hydrolase [Tetrahymena thermophila SB210]|eukprot:XP_001032237.1 NUDIX hydrolase [Tetrahymena thermophila SB210]